MASRRQQYTHLFNGGFATDFGPTANVAPNQAGQVVFPFLREASNVFYELDGGPHKIGGTAKLNSVAVASGAKIRGLFDYWRQGTTASPTQKRVLYASTQIFADAADGTFVSIKSGLEDLKVPCFTVFGDNLILSSDSTVDVPMTYDQTNVTTLGGTPPQFSFSCVHKNRVWAAGVASNPSRLYYSAQLNAADWTTATSGSIDIDPSDGDRITAIASHKDNLWVFKGPYKGSIHRITGSANTGSDSFQRQTFVNGIGAVSHNTIFRLRDDLGFMWADGTIHSLAATAAYGDYNESALSRPIHQYLRDHLTLGFLNRAWAATDVRRSQVIFTIPIDTSSFCNQILMMDFSRPQVWWAIWPSYDANCVASVIDSTNSNARGLMIGSQDGFVRRTNLSNRSIDGATAITAKATTPFTNYGNPFITKTIATAALGIAPKGNYTAQFGWTRDNNAQQTQTVSEGGGNVLDSFILDTSVLGGSSYVDRFLELEEGGEFRSISYQALNSGLNQDLELHSLSATVEVGAESTENAA
jgi:hypothetical protein